jgi:Protein of unknown function (DUF4231)
MTFSSPQLAPVRPDPWWIVIQHPAHVPLPLNVVERGRWYRREMKSARIRAQLIDVAILIATAAVPCVVAASAPGWVGAFLGGIAAVGTGLRQVFGWQRNWASFSRANVQIESEIVRFGQGVGEYAPPATAAALLATRVEDITASETGSWAKQVDRVEDKSQS